MKKHLDEKTVILVSSTDRAFLSHRIPIAKALKEKCKNILIICSDTGCINNIKALGFNVTPFPACNTKINFSTALRNCIFLFRTFRNHRPDLVHLSSLYISFLGGIASFKLRETNMIQAITGLGYLFTSDSPRAKLLRTVLSPIFRLCWNKRTSYFLFQNSDDAEVFRKYRFVSSNFRIIPGSGIDEIKFSQKPSFESKTLIIGCACRLLKDKGVGELVEASTIIDSDINVIIRIAGEPDPKNPSSFSESEIRKWADNPRLHLEGHVSDMKQFWHGCHIAILPSYREGMPKSLLEAASCGLMLLGADVPGTRDLIEHNFNGFLFPKGSAQGIANAITSSVQNQNFVSLAGHRSRQKIINSGFSEKSIAASYIKLIESL